MNRLWYYINQIWVSLISTCILKFTLCNITLFLFLPILQVVPKINCYSHDKYKLPCSTGTTGNTEGYGTSLKSPDMWLLELKWKWAWLHHKGCHGLFIQKVTVSLKWPWFFPEQSFSIFIQNSNYHWRGLSKEVFYFFLA